MLSRATILLMASQAIFLLSGFLMHAILARLLGVENYGTFGLVMSILIIAELFVITGIPEAIQKFGGAQPEAMQKLVSKTLSWQIIYATVVLVLFWLIAPLLAKGFADEKLTPLLRLACFDIIFYGLYKYFLGVQNGLHRFIHYTILAVSYSIIKLIAIVSLVWLGYSVTGAIIGNMIGSILVLVIAWMFSRLPKSTAELQEIPYLSFVTQNVFYFVGLNLFFTIDLWIVKYYLTDVNVGLYVSAGTLAKVTYIFSIALSAVLLPSLSRSIKLKQLDRVKEITQDSLRYLLIFLVLINIVIAANSVKIVELFFGATYVEAAPILTILTVGLSLVTMMAIINTIMIAQNKMKDCFTMIAGLLVLDVSLGLVLVPQFGLAGAALATTMVGIVGTIWGGMYILKDFKDLLFSLSPLRIAGAALLVFLLSNGLDLISLDVIIKSALIAGVYFMLLWLTRELNSIDLRRLRESVGIS